MNDVLIVPHPPNKHQPLITARVSHSFRAVKLETAMPSRITEREGRRRRARRRYILDIVGICSLMRAVDAFVPLPTHRVAVSQPASPTTLYGFNQGMYNRRGGAGGAGGKSKRQERVGQLVQTELSQILHTGIIKGSDVEYLDATLRCRISVVRADVSPDLRQARISISVRPTQAVSGDADGTVVPADDRGEAHAWLVRNANAIRHTVAQRMSHIKSSCPALTFALVDVTAAVDVMHLIDQVSAGSSTGGKRMLDWDPEEMARVMMGGDDEEDEEDDLDDDDWEETDVDFFKSKK